MTFEDFWSLYETAVDLAEDNLVQFGVTREGAVVTMSYGVKDWSPVRSPAVERMERARFHTMAMQETHLAV